MAEKRTQTNKDYRQIIHARREEAPQDGEKNQRQKTLETVARKRQRCCFFTGNTQDIGRTGVARAKRTRVTITHRAADNHRRRQRTAELSGECAKNPEKKMLHKTPCAIIPVFQPVTL